MRQKLAVVALIVIAAVAVFAMFAVRDEVRVARFIAGERESAQRALLVEASKLLQDYHASHNRYPETLSDLPFTDPNYGGRSLLEHFVYESRPGGYHLRTVGSLSGETYKDSK
jgi:Tfp pilus assembly protein PilE